MSLLSTMNAATNGLNAHINALGVVSDNIANLNTIGYKASRGRFSDVLGGALGSGVDAGNSPGQGATFAGMDTSFTQGNLISTGVGTDLALKGDGFFITRGELEGFDGLNYTRVGQFHLDDEGRLADANGLIVQGYVADPQGNFNSVLGDLTLMGVVAPPQRTGAIDVVANLDAAASVPAAFDPADAPGTSNYSTSIVVYDSLGAIHNVDIYFRKSAASNWEWHAMVDGGELTGGTAGTPTQVANGTLSFTTDGSLDTEATASSNANFIGATANQVIDFDFGDSITTDGGTGRVGVTSFAGPSDVTRITQDGIGAGTLSGVNISEDGAIVGAFSNGERRIIARVAVARFSDNSGLQRLGNGMYASTARSGQPLIGAAGSGGRGNVASGSLEQSNVDLTAEFINMIAYQRGFQANSRTVKTADEMLAELVNLTR